MHTTGSSDGRAFIIRRFFLTGIPLSIQHLLRTVIFTANKVITEKSEKQRFATISSLLCTVVFMAYYFYGLRAFLVALTTVLSSYLAEYLSMTAMRRKFDWSDVSPLMNGLLLALLMPASVPYSVAALSAAFMATICKHAFGGNENLIFCPVCTAYIFTSLCFPLYLLRYPSPEPFGSVPLNNVVSDGLTYSYTRALDTKTASTFSLLDIVWGKLAGPMGTAAVLIILIAAVALYFFRYIPPTALFAGMGANILINVIFPVGETGWYAVLNSLVAGSYFFVYVFMACDPRYLPKREFSQLVWGIGFAAASYLIRLYTSIENSAIFALPMFCIFRDEFDRLTNSLERLLKFIGKRLAIGAAFARKYLKIGAAKFCKFAAREISSFSKWLKKKIDERRQSEKEAEPEESGEGANPAENSEDNTDSEKAEEKSEDEAENSAEAEADGEGSADE